MAQAPGTKGREVLGQKLKKTAPSQPKSHSETDIQKWLVRFLKLMSRSQCSLDLFEQLVNFIVFCSHFCLEAT